MIFFAPIKEFFLIFELMYIYSITQFSIIVLSEDTCNVIVSPSIQKKQLSLRRFDHGIVTDKS